MNVLHPAMIGHIIAIRDNTDGSVFAGRLIGFQRKWHPVSEKYKNITEPYWHNIAFLSGLETVTWGDDNVTITVYDDNESWLDSDEPDGVWELTPAGRALVQSLETADGV